MDDRLTVSVQTALQQLLQQSVACNGKQSGQTAAALHIAMARQNSIVCLGTPA